MTTELKITMVQPNLFWESPKKNREFFSNYFRSIVTETDLIILPEMFSTGFSMNAAKLAEDMGGETMEWMHKNAAEKKAVITGSLIIKEDNKYYNRLIWMNPNGSFSHYDKRHLFSLAEEEKTYSRGNHQWIMPLNGWKIFPLICYDLRFPVWSRRTKSLEYDVLLYVANWPEKRNLAWNQLLVARAIENQSYVIGVNRVGEDENKIIYKGESAAIDYKGELISTFKPYEEKHETILLNKRSLVEFREQFSFAKDGDDFTLS
ncbi:MAG: amidohydrolase [Bacteroidetes bacterium]|nr:MAG: amidohydrolase [Bacteroidota bacterium]